MTVLKQALTTVSLIVCIISLKTALASDATQGSKTGQTITTQTKGVPVKNEIRRGTVEELVRIRCATDGSDQWTTWTGRIFSFVPGERQKLLFNVVGANVARCKKNAKDQWYFTSRELMYYLDPKTNKPLKVWENPWTKRSVPVMHVANDLVQGVLRGSPKINISGPMASRRFYRKKLLIEATFSQAAEVFEGHNTHSSMDPFVSENQPQPHALETSSV